MKRTCNVMLTLPLPTPFPALLSVVYVRHLKSLTDGLLIIWRWSDRRVTESSQWFIVYRGCLKWIWMCAKQRNKHLNFKCVRVTCNVSYEKNVFKEGNSVCARCYWCQNLTTLSICMLWSLSVRWMADGRCSVTLSRNFVTMFLISLGSRPSLLCMI